MVYGWFSVFSSEKSVFSSEKCGKQYIEPHFAFLADWMQNEKNAAIYRFLLHWLKWENELKAYTWTTNVSNVSYLFTTAIANVLQHN